MPKVGKMRFPYTEQGVKEAQKYSQAMSPEKEQAIEMLAKFSQSAQAMKLKEMQMMKAEAIKRQIQSLGGGLGGVRPEVGGVSPRTRGVKPSLPMNRMPAQQPRGNVGGLNSRVIQQQLRNLKKR